MRMSITTVRRHTSARIAATDMTCRRLDEAVDEPDEDQANADDDAADEE